MDATTFDWQSWLACGLGLLAVAHLTRRWWPKRLQRHHRLDHTTTASSATPGSGTGCGTVEAPSACAGGGCGSCGSSTTPIRVHRRTSRDTSGATPNP